jgi:hypothetical protein
VDDTAAVICQEGTRFAQKNSFFVTHPTGLDIQLFQPVMDSDKLLVIEPLPQKAADGDCLREKDRNIQNTAETATRAARRPAHFMKVAEPQQVTLDGNRQQVHAACDFDRSAGCFQQRNRRALKPM